ASKPSRRTRNVDRARVRAAAGTAGAPRHDPVAQRDRAADLWLERGGREQCGRIPDPHHPQEARSHGDPQRTWGRLDGRSSVMIRSLRGRLYLGLSLVILLAAAVGAMIAYAWAFDEAIEIQDSVLMQVASLAQTGSVGGAPVHGIEESSDIRIIELGTAPRGAAEHRHLFSLQDGLHVASYDGQRLRFLLRTRSDGSR